MGRALDRQKAEKEADAAKKEQEEAKKKEENAKKADEEAKKNEENCKANQGKWVNGACEKEVEEPEKNAEPEKPAEAAPAKPKGDLEITRKLQEMRERKEKSNDVDDVVERNRKAFERDIRYKTPGLKRNRSPKISVSGNKVTVVPRRLAVVPTYSTADVGMPRQ